MTLIGWLHITVGGSVFAATLCLLVLGMVRGWVPGGLPLEWTLVLAAIAALGPGLGVALLRRRPWAWFAVSLLYLVLVAGFTASILLLLDTPAAALASEPGLIPLSPSGLASLFPKIPPAIIALLLGVTGLVYLYLLSPGARRPFELARSWWTVPLIQLLVCLAVAVPSFLFAREALLERRVETLIELGERATSSPDAIGFIVERLENGQPAERGAAAWALGQCGGADAVALLRSVGEEDPEPIVRANAVAALAVVGGAGAIQQLLEFLDAEEPEVRSAALGALVREGLTPSAEQIGRVLDGADASSRAMAVDLLGGMGTEEAISILLEAAPDPEADVRGRIAFALGKYRDARALPMLLVMLDDERWEVRANAVQALGMVGDPKVRPQVERMLDDPNAQVRWTAERTVEKLR